MTLDISNMFLDSGSSSSMLGEIQRCRNAPDIANSTAAHFGEDIFRHLLVSARAVRLSLVVLQDLPPMAYQPDEQLIAAAEG